MTAGSAERLLSALSDRLDELPEPERHEYVRENELDIVLDRFGHGTTQTDSERERLAVLQDATEELTERFEDHDVAFVVIKSPIVDKPLSDIDILVDKSDDFAAALAAAGYVREDDTEPHRQTYVKKVEGERVAVDLHLALSWRRVPYVDAGEILADRERRRIGSVEIPVPAPRHDLAITAAHSVFKHNEVSMFDILHATSVRETFDVSEAAVRDVAARNNWLSQYEGFVADVDAVVGDLLGPEPTDRRAIDLPIEFPLPRVLSVRVRRLAAEAMDGDLRMVGIAGFAYTLDVTQYVVEERLGYSMKPFFDGLSALKRVIES